MPEQECNNRQFARTLAELCLYYGMDKVPVVLNSQQYEYFVEDGIKQAQKDNNG